MVAVGLMAIVTGGISRSAAGAAAPTQPMLIGVHQDVVAHSYDHARAAIAAARDVLGAQVSRSTLRWNIVEPTPGQFDWSHADFVVDELKAAGIEPLFTLLGSPAWANGVGAGVPNHDLYVPRDQASFDKWLTDFTRFAREAARRYRGEIDLWEVWNEPNEHFFWLPEPNAARYAQLYRAVSAAIHSENPEARVAVGGLAGVGAGCCITGLEFTRTLIAAGVPLDTVAVHPYPSNGHAPDVHMQFQDNFDDIGAMRRLLDNSGLAHVELWVTEWGWSSSQVGAATQAAYMRRSLEMIRDQFPYVTVATAFLDADRPDYSEGLLTAAFAPKPAGLAFADFQRSRAAVTKPPAPPQSGPATPITRSSSAPPNTQPGSAPPARHTPSVGGAAQPPSTAPKAPQPLRLMSKRFALTPETARVGRSFGVTMRVVRSDTRKPLAGGAFTARATVAGMRLKLVRKGWHRATVRAQWRVPPWAKGKTITGSITVRYRGAMITKRFSARVR